MRTNQVDDVAKRLGAKGSDIGSRGGDERRNGDQDRRETQRAQLAREEAGLQRRTGDTGVKGGWNEWEPAKKNAMLNTCDCRHAAETHRMVHIDGSKQHIDGKAVTDLSTTAEAVGTAVVKTPTTG